MARRQSNLEVDSIFDARARHGQAAAALRYIRPFADEKKKELLSALIMASRNPALTDSVIRARVGEIAGIDALEQYIDSIMKQSAAKMEKQDG